MPKKGKGGGGLDRKKADPTAVEKRVVILDQEKCKPNSAAFAYLQRWAGSCGGQCILVKGKKIAIWEEACGACLNRAKKCPGGAVTIMKLPTNLTTDCTHRYGENMFKLHGLPTPRPGHVLGLLGTNGIGKSTAVKVLAGQAKPNLGEFDSPASWEDIIAYYRGSELQNYFTKLVTEELGIVIKPQMDTQKMRVPPGMKVKEIVAKRDECGRGEHIMKKLDLWHLLEREIVALSGGEMQRLVCATTAMRQADVYVFDEASSFLDVRQRLAVTEVIRSLVTPELWAMSESGGVATKKYVIVVEHDLAVLDYMSDQICCLYGEPGVYGVVTNRMQVSNGVNQFLAGYFPAENMRFRDHSLDFRLTIDDQEDPDFDLEEADDKGPGAGKYTPGMTRYPALSKTLTDSDKGTSFTLHVEAGNFKDHEVICMLGENGMGKTTFMKLLAGRCFDEVALEPEPDLEPEPEPEPEKAKKKKKKKTGKGGKKAKVAASSSEEEEEEPPPPPPPKKSLREMGISFKRQHNAPRYRQYKGTVQRLLETTIQHGLHDRLFRLKVLYPLGVHKMENIKVASLSGGELQRVAICICLGTPAQIYLLDEPSAGLDCEQRIIVGKVIKKWVVSHLGKTAFVVEHDFLMATALADRVIVFKGQPGLECTACAPVALHDGMNVFLKQMNVTFRRDPVSFRPRINKLGSRLDAEQKAAGQYYMVDEAGDAPSGLAKSGKRTT